MKIETKRVISAAHIVDGNTKCANLHGHNWTVSVSIDNSGTDIPKDGFLMDFNSIKEEIDKLDHRFLVSTEQIKGAGITNYDILAGGRKYSIPARVCVKIPIPYTTSEWICKYLISRFREILYNSPSINHAEKWKVCVRIEETENNIAEECL